MKVSHAPLRQLRLPLWAHVYKVIDINIKKQPRENLTPQEQIISQL